MEDLEKNLLEILQFDKKALIEGIKKDVIDSVHI